MTGGAKAGDIQSWTGGPYQVVQRKKEHREPDRRRREERTQLMNKERRRRSAYGIGEQERKTGRKSEGKDGETETRTERQTDPHGFLHP